MSTTVPGIAPEFFRRVFRNHPAGVVVITADAGRGPAGFTATSLTSLSLDPPLVAFGIGTGSSSWPHVERAPSVVVNFLAAQQQEVARRFATRGIDRFGPPTRWSRHPAGDPVLDGVAGWLRVSVERAVPAGDHRIVIARVEEAWVDDESSPLVFHDGGYRTL
ncbi:flavin reductase family protein [Streptomyces montanisoli]|uniref:Flavin reductase family protein n=1 Tax=Streptomyces montanisoli TaxID=2798581 RepID=A0A940MDF2_9ACTN|nr:flavin reductase family protein [Streptomyces montanisoli]MBP0460979.1 flavin reductase family protein [Streptomyces montanisoli]